MILRMRSDPREERLSEPSGFGPLSLRNQLVELLFHSRSVPPICPRLWANRGVAAGGPRWRRQVKSVRAVLRQHQQIQPRITEVLGTSDARVLNVPDCDRLFL